MYRYNFGYRFSGFSNDSFESYVKQKLKVTVNNCIKLEILPCQRQPKQKSRILSIQ